MTKEEFIDKWKYQSAIGYGLAQLDFSKQLNIDLKDILIQFAKYMEEDKEYQRNDELNVEDFIEKNK